MLAFSGQAFITQKCESHNNIVDLPEKTEGSQKADNFVRENKNPEHSAEKAGNREQEVGRRGCRKRLLESAREQY